MTTEMLDTFEAFEKLAKNPPTYGTYGKWLSELQGAWSKYQRALKRTHKKNGEPDDCGR